MDNNTVGIIVALLAIFVTIAIFFLLKRKKAAHNDVLITGISNSGKTLLFSLLIHNKAARTHTSIKENCDTYMTDERALRLVDIPGDERLRYKYLDHYKQTARAILFLIDSSTIHKDLRDVAEYLYTLMTDAAVSSNVQSILIFCNKQDVPLCKGVTYIKTQLEKELNILRNTKTSQLDATEATDSKSVLLGSDGAEFDFSQYPAEVECAEGHVFSDSADPSSNYEQIEDWLANL